MSDGTGYKKPPTANQFKKGSSGNPTGRPKGRLNVATVIEQALTTLVTVNEGGRRVKRSKFGVAMTQLANQAASGDLQATRMILGIAPQWAAEATAAHIQPDLKADRELAMKVMTRFAGANSSKQAVPESTPTSAPAQANQESDHE